MDNTGAGKLSFGKFLRWFFFALAAGLVLWSVYVLFWATVPCAYRYCDGVGFVLLWPITGFLIVVGWLVILISIVSSEKDSPTRKLITKLSKILFILFLLSLVTLLYFTYLFQVK